MILFQMVLSIGASLVDLATLIRARLVPRLVPATLPT